MDEASLFCSEARKRKQVDVAEVRRLIGHIAEARRYLGSKSNPRRSLRSTDMTAVPAHDQLSPLPAPADTPVIRCKKCKGPLPDTAWKNCSSCRRARTESYNRWKKSASLRSMRGTGLGESLLRLRQHSSSPFRTVDYSTLSQAQPPGPTAPLDHHSDELSHRGDPSKSSNDQPRRTSASAVPPPVGATEYQWSDELIEALLALPPRSRYIGKFSIIADPEVDNTTRAHLFATQLHARAVPISCVVPSRRPASHLFPFTPPQPR